MARGHVNDPTAFGTNHVQVLTELVGVIGAFCIVGRHIALPVKGHLAAILRQRDRISSAGNQLVYAL
jgi:hypothetical protein